MASKKDGATFEAVAWRRGAVVLLDQRKLPTVERSVTLREPAAVARAIRDMVVRGAPAIGVAGAMGVALAARRASARGFDATVARAERTLEAARPTAVNLRWAIERMRAVREGSRDVPVTQRRQRLEAEALAIAREDVEANRRLGAHGAPLLAEASSVLTYCNAGALATAGYGTALGVIRAARERGSTLEVIAAETRPFLQGARLTAWELAKDRIPVTLAADGALGSLFQAGRIDAVVVGTDRTAANGDVANKVGTYVAAVLAKRHGVPFYVAAPTSSIDLACRSGAAIPIEERSPDEVTSFAGRRVAPVGVGAVNPAFDVTPASLVTAIVTENGVARPPYRKTLPPLVRGGRSEDG